MTTDIQNPSQPPGSPEPGNVFTRIAGVLFSPGETFAAIVKRPDIVGPLLIIVLIGYATTALIMPRFDYEALLAQQAEQMRKSNPDMSDEQLAQVARFTRASAQVFGWISPIALIAMYALIAGVLLLAFRLFGGEGRYAQAFSVTLYAWMVMVLGSIVTTVVIVARGSFDPATAATLVKSNPAFLVDLKEQPVLFSLFSSLDLFTIWFLVLLSIGFAAMSRLSKAKAATLVFSLWLALVLIKVCYTALTASRLQG